MKKVLLTSLVVLLFGSVALAQIASGPVLGSIASGNADTGTSEYINISLNSTAVADLNANLGGLFILGGAVSNTTYAVPEVDLWGYNSGSPVAFLEINGSTLVDATGEGWCSNVVEEGCDNTNTSVIENMYAGEEGTDGDLQNWMAFTLPGTTVTSASINIYNLSNNYTNNPAALYNLYEVGQSISYGPPQVAAPEPCSLTLLGLGLLGLAGVGRRKLLN